MSKHSGNGMMQTKVECYDCKTPTLFWHHRDAPDPAWISCSACKARSNAKRAAARMAREAERIADVTDEDIWR